MENSKNYHDEQNNINTLRMREVLSTLPPFCKQFFRGIQEYTSSRTRLAYAYDIRVFFEFMHSHNSICSKMEITDFPISILEQITREDIEEYYNQALELDPQLLINQIISEIKLYNDKIEIYFNSPLRTSPDNQGCSFFITYMHNLSIEMYV